VQPEQAATEEQINKKFSVKPGGTIVVDVDFGGIEVGTNGTSEVLVDVWRKVGRNSKSAEETFLKENPVKFSQDGDKVTIIAKSKSKSKTVRALAPATTQTIARKLDGPRWVMEYLRLALGTRTRPYGL